MRLKPLSEVERRVIIDRETEAPFSGEYESYNQKGVYACRQCGAYLYRSETKFEAHCGWPSFDEAVLGAVDQTPDPDGRRTEISCKRCGGHLGHVFTGEHFTLKNTRHCVNSISLEFIPEEKINHEPGTGYFGGGCFWCTEASFLNIKGVLAVTSGYAGGVRADPTYAQVCSGETGHAEVVKVTFEPTVISYEALLTVFFVIHDPTTKNYQGGDHGSQYRSIILYERDWQKETSENKITVLNELRIFDQPIVTEVDRLTKFYPAEDYHQNYFAKNPEAGYCQAVIAPKLTKLRHELKTYLK